MKMNPKTNSSVISLNSTSTILNMESEDNPQSISSCGSMIDLENMTPRSKPQESLDNRSPNFMSMVHHKWRKMLRRDSAEITPTDPSYKSIYLGNVVTTWAKGEGCLERPASALWKNHCQGRGSIKMLISVAPSGLKAQTREHGLTEYWANRLTWCGVPPDYPKLFCWIYRHEGRKLKQELRCHAVLCSKEVQATRLANSLRNRLTEALFDFKKEKILRQNARLSIVQSLYNTSSNKRKLVLMNSNSQNYKPPLERSKSAPKLSCIEEFEEEEYEENFPNSHMTIPECESVDEITVSRHTPHLSLRLSLPLPDEEEEAILSEGSLKRSSPIPTITTTARTLPIASLEEESNNEEDRIRLGVDETSFSHHISHRKSYPNSQVLHHPDGPRRPHTVPMDAKLNLPYMTGYDKVMHLLDMPPGESRQLLLDGDDDDEFSFAGPNSDPLASSPGSDASGSVVDSSSCEDEYTNKGRRRSSSVRKRGDEDRDDEINDNVSDESGYSEEAVVSKKRGDSSPHGIGGNNDDLNLDPNGSPTLPKKSSTKNYSTSTIIITGNEITDPNRHKTKTSTTTTFKSDENGGTTATTLVVYDNLCFEI